jgi:hypothetical protein
MDLSAIIVILVLTALSLGALVWMEIQSRRRQREEATDAKAAAGLKDSDRARAVSESGINGA